MRNPEMEERILDGLRNGYWCDREFANRVNYYLKCSDIDGVWTILQRIAEVQMLNTDATIMHRFITPVILAVFVSLFTAVLFTFSKVLGWLAAFVLFMLISQACLSLFYLYNTSFGVNRYTYFTNWHKVLCDYINNDIFEENTKYEKS